MRTIKPWSNEEITYLRERYPFDTSGEIASYLQRSRGSVCGMASILKLTGSKVIRRPANRQYTINERFFATWTPEMAYVVGFVLADGCLQPRRVDIASNDRQILEAIAKVMGSEHPIKKAKSKDLFELRIGSSWILQDLKDIGLTPAKSKTATLPVVSDDLFFHLLRGYFDGDGGIYIRGRASLHIKMASGSLVLLEEISHRVSNLLKMDLRPIINHEGERHGRIAHWHELSYCGRGAARLAEAMYEQGHDLCLERKWQTYDRYCHLAPNQIENACKYDRIIVDPIVKQARARELARLRARERRARLKQTLNSGR